MNLTSQLNEQECYFCDDQVERPILYIFLSVNGAQPLCQTIFTVKMNLSLAIASNFIFCYAFRMLHIFC